MVVIAALYHFTDLPDVLKVHEKFKNLCTNLGIKGTLLFAHEGINGTVAGTREAIDELLATLKSDNRFEGMEYKESTSDEMPFYRLKVKLKNEIVTLRVPEANPHHMAGTYVDPKDWNALISDPDVIVLDTRNDYEVKIGTFENAVNPETDVFVQFPSYVREKLNAPKNKKIAMFCTGGIRCEKASSFMKLEGYEEVYHLKGGILKYLEEVPQEESLWKGDCFVFDQRVSVGHGLTQGEYKVCFGCRMPLSPEECLSEHYVEGVECHLCYDKITAKARHANVERQKQIVIAKSQNKQHIGGTRI
ncbi:MAG: rhodanese-related sulfurtransferase [Candidatus Paracaedibacteraceae bacterium]|nr:rhodanese-related sulfurtransferase [Candidatus Paracaedibacteraceae bacterium]